MVAVCANSTALKARIAELDRLEFKARNELLILKREITEGQHEIMNLSVSNIFTKMNKSLFQYGRVHLKRGGGRWFGRVHFAHLIFLGNAYSGNTLVSLIVVQDILIVFQHFSSQDILIKDRTFINFRTFSPQDVI